jgi:hypothetical protein
MSKRIGQSRKLGPLAKRHLRVVPDLGSLVNEAEAHSVCSTLAAEGAVAMVLIPAVVPRVP